MSPVTAAGCCREGAAPDTLALREEAAGLGVAAGVVRVLLAGMPCSQVCLGGHKQETNNGSHYLIWLALFLCYE